MPIYVDNSILDAVSSCSSEAVLRYVLGYTTRQQAAHLRAGSAGHKAFEAWFGGSDLATANGIFENEYRAWVEQAFDDGERVEDRLTFENTSRILDYWLQTHPVASFPWVVDPALVEVGFSVPLTDDGEYMLVGLADLITTDKHTGDTYIVDHKFTGRVSHYWMRQFYMSSQLSGYQWAASQYLDPGKQVVGSYINAVEFSKLPSDPVRKCAKHATPYAECGPLHTESRLLGPFMRTPAQLEAWRQTAIGLAKRYESLMRTYPTIERLGRVRMEGMFNGSCRFCEFHDFCRMGRPAGYADSMLMADRWEPFPLAFSGGVEHNAE